MSSELIIAKVIPYHPSWDIIDTSKLNEDFLQCDRKYFFRNILGWVRDEPNIHLVFGEAWHRAQEVILLANYHPDCIITAIDVFEKHYRQFFSPMADDINYPKVPGRALDAIAKYIKEYGASDSSRYKCLYTEIAGAAPLLDGRSIFYRLDSILQDLETGQHLSREHKTGSRLDARWQDKWTLANQPSTYTHVLYCLYPPEDVYGIMVNGAIFRKNDTEFVRVPVRKAPAQMEAWILDMRRHLQRLNYELDKLVECSPDDIAMEAFPRNTRNCMDFYGCPYHPYCCAWSNPLRHCDKPPMGMVVSFWNPMDRQYKATVNFETKEVKKLETVESE